MEHMVRVLLRCRLCGHREMVTVTEASLLRWQADEDLIQKIFPDLSADQRELLITGTCGECFDKMVGNL